MGVDGHKSDDGRSPWLSDPTDIAPVGAFDATDRASLEPDLGRHTQLTSDPPTGLVRRDVFRELPPGTVVGDTYEIDARLGAGAMGEVYAARHMGLGKRVAIKVIGQRLSKDEAAIERFAMEARTLAQIQHPSIVAVDHVGDLADGRAYFVMEFLRGESLFERLQRGRIPLPEALRILDQMARGLDAAHGEGVTHRDLKPENTFLVHLPGEPPAIKLLDFGLAKLAAARADEDRRAERTQSGVAIGTPMYMSPEQMRGPDVDHRTDIYALGCVAYELVLGVPPFPHAKTAPALYAAHLHEAPALPRTSWPEIPTQIDLCLFAMLAKDPEHRPTLAQIRSVIAAVRADNAEQRAATEFVAGSRSVQASRKRVLIAGVVAIALVGTLITGITIGARAGSPMRGRADPGSSLPLASPSVVPSAAPFVDASPPSSSSLVPSVTPQTTRESSDPPIVRPAKVIKPVAPPRKPPPPPLDAGSNGSAVEIPLPKNKPVDRNQTINPFAAKKRFQATP